MDLPISQEEDIPIPINSKYGHGHLIHHYHNQHHHYHRETAPQPHNHIVPSSSSAPSSGCGTTMPAEGMEHESTNYKKRQQQQQVMISYRECMKNHAAAMGGNAMDGCGEFMPSGEEGSLEALTCSACNCHRNFHRKEVEGQPSPQASDCYRLINRESARKLINLAPLDNNINIRGMVPAEAFGYPTTGGAPLVPAGRSVPIIPYHMGFLPSESDEQEDGRGCCGEMGSELPYRAVKKRSRTKFTQEQKEKMFSFAEKVGWKLQKQDESVVQQFCQEICVKRRVLKVWMHNNKHNLSKKNPSSTAA
ncbi:hypothetical protein Nepgr_026293 [Nepenthes gracilis]|uniref:ZF-HD dimerization-type domain-containing protein n=1 Tax=Nepenthes gracilis TaxID=150966 RepID=A0AAD3Y1W6_NEPGR|nr:hypothetical protein Nepgr_026293 [Nepenthes gracilis]